MQAAIDIFLNGIAGVFAGMIVLYLVIKLIAVIGREPAPDSKEQ